MAFSVEYLYRIIDKMSPMFNKMASASNKFDKKFTSGLNRAQGAFQKTGAKLANLQTGVASLGAGVILKDVIDTTNEYKESLGNIGTLIPGQEERLNSLDKTIKKVAIDAGKNLNDISGGAFQVISAFGDMQGETEGRLQAVTKAAVAGGSETVEALNLLSAVTKGYGDTSAIALSKASDLAFMTNKIGQTTFPELAASIGAVVPFAAKLSVSQEELFAGFASLTGVTGNTSEVATQMRSILVAMLKPTTDMQKAVRGLGFESSASMIKQVGLGESLKLLTTYTGGNEQAMAKLFGRAEALTGVFALSDSQADKYSDALSQMMLVSQNVGAVTNEAFLEITSGVNKSGFSLKQLTTKIQVLKIAFGEQLAPILNEVIDKYISPLIEKLNNLSPATKKNIVVGLGLVAALGAVLIPLGLMISTIGSLISLIKVVTLVTKAWGIITAFMTGLTKAQAVAVGLSKVQIIAYKIGTLAAAAATKVWAVAQGIFNAVMSLNPIAKVILIITILVGVIILAIKYWDKITAAILIAWKWIVKAWDVLKGVVLLLGGPFVAIGTFVIEIIRSIANSWSNITEKFKSGGILAGIKAIGGAILAGLLSPIQSFLELVSKIPGVGNLAKGAAEKIARLRAGLQGIDMAEKVEVAGGVGVTPPYPITEVPIAKGPPVNFKTQTQLSVYKEPGIGVMPFSKKGNLGYQMEEEYSW